MPDPDHRSPPERGQPLTGNGDELFGVSGDPGATGPIRAYPRGAPPDSAGPQGRAPYQDHQPAPDSTSPMHRRADTVAAPGPLPGGMWQPDLPPPSSSRRRFSGGGAVVVALGSLLLVVVLLAGLWVASRDDITSGQATPGAPAPVVHTDTGAELVQRATRTDSDCAAHSYGRVKQFLTRTPCTSLARALYTADSSHGPVVVSVSTVVMASPADAANLQQLTDATGTGNVADLLREGVKVESGPSRLRDASYASRRDGSTVVIVEAAATSGKEHSLDPLAQAALALGG